MTGEEKEIDAWLQRERERLDAGFSFEPSPGVEADESSAADDALAGGGLGAALTTGTMGGHDNPVVFEGCKPDLIVSALRSEISSDDTRITTEEIDAGTVVTVLQSPSDRPHDFIPALTVTLIERADVLMATISGLSRDSKRKTLAAIGKTALKQGTRLFLSRRGLYGMLREAGSLVESVQDVADDVEDLGLSKRVWAVIDRVGGAAEQAYLEEKRQRRDRRRRREAAERAWTHCEWCGRAYAGDEDEVVQCSSCGAPRGSKPKWMT